jgi:hypothetical protein
VATQIPVESQTVKGPSGFIQLGTHNFVVDYGKIYHDGLPIGFLFEDGYLRDTSGPFGQTEGLKLIDQITGCEFRGIDSCGLELELPGGRVGPTGTLKFNDVALNVVNGRIATPYHELVGQFEDDGTIFLRDSLSRVALKKLNENTQLATSFEGTKSSGEQWTYEFVRPLTRKDKPYFENEIIRYFEYFDKLQTVQKKYVIESMKLWASCGLLQIVRKSEGTTALGSVKHGAAGVTGVRTGNATLDEEEFEKEIALYKRFGPIAVVSTKIKPYTEVRVNLVVAHEFGHQLEFVLAQKTQDAITDIYDKRRKQCDKNHPLPPEYQGLSELVTPDQVHKRVFISGYARHSMHEYWAECVAAFSVKTGREYLKQIDPAIHGILEQLITEPQALIRPVFHELIQDLQLALKLGGEFDRNLLDN